MEVTPKQSSMLISKGRVLRVSTAIKCHHSELLEGLEIIPLTIPCSSTL
ncbi:hypothetical protein TNCV_797611, partial [Trichonephila clavipes]